MKISELSHFARLRAAWDFVVTSLWFVPLLMMLAGIVLAGAGLFVDARLGTGDVKQMPWWIYVARADDARELVGSLLTSSITMTSLVFSITMVVLTLAANQFGPRLVRNFMDSALTQAVLGTFTMTMLYCLMVLASIGRRSSDVALPYASISLAVVLMAVSILLLVLFIHALARSIVSETVIDRVGRELDDLVHQLEPVSQEPSKPPEASLPEDFDTQSACFGPPAAGYVQAVEFERLVAVACRADVLIGLYFRAGDHVVSGGRTVAVYPRSRCRPELVDEINRALAIGAHRTPVQDPEFGIRHLVEIAVRALSPGINDPYTAVAVIHRLAASLACAMEHAMPPGVFCDNEGIARVVSPQPTYAGLVNGAYDQIRQNGADKPLVVLHLFKALDKIADHVSNTEQLDVLVAQHAMILEDALRATASTADRKDVERASREVRLALARAADRLAHPVEP